MKQELCTQPVEQQSNRSRIFALVTECTTRIVSAPKAPRAWYLAFYISLVLLAVFVASVAWSISNGIGVWGNMHPVAWGWPIVNFVFWIGIAHAGTLISAILFLLRQEWRTAINRFAEAMTVSAVLCASIYPIIHLGRPWFFYWLFPYLNQMGMWPQFRSPLTWDVFAVCTYAAVSAMFLYLGMIPDFATFRDREKRPRWRFAYRLLALGWCGSSQQWHRHERAYVLLAGLAAPLVISVHSIVSLDFSVSQLPGWHTTIFPPYFVCGAIFGGLAMLVILAIPARHFFGLKEIIQIRHFEAVAKIMLAMSLLIGYTYGIELFFAWYDGSIFESFTFLNRVFGPYGWAYWTMLTCNLLVPQVFWLKACRRNLKVVLAVGILVTIGMWFERFVIVCTSQSRDFLPSSWGVFTPTALDLTTFIGSFGLFLTLFLLFCRYFPILAMSEIKLESSNREPCEKVPKDRCTPPEPFSGNRAPTGKAAWQAVLKDKMAAILSGRCKFYFFIAIGVFCMLNAFKNGGTIGDGFRSLMESYYVAFVFVLSIALGALAWLILSYLVRARWTDDLRSVLENISSALPVVALMFLPILVTLKFGKIDLFTWASLGTPSLQHKAVYLNVSFFIFRWIAYFSIWIVLASQIKNRKIRCQEKSPSQSSESMQAFSMISMVLLAITMTFAAIDTLVVLSPEWSSSIMGVYFFCGCILSIVGTVVLIQFLTNEYAGAVGQTAMEKYHNLGKMLFAFILLWGYVAFSQYLIIWYANIPSEAMWFNVRLNGDWKNLSIILICGHFFLPFFGLLSKRAKRNPRGLVFWAAWMVIMHYIDIYWLTMPSLNPEHTQHIFLDFLCLFGLGAIFFAAVVYTTKKNSVPPLTTSL